MFYLIVKLRTAHFVEYTVVMVFPEDLKQINMSADGDLKHSDILADMKVETGGIPISIKEEPVGLEDYDVKYQISDIIGDHSSSECKPDCLEIKEELMEDNESFEHKPWFSNEQHKTCNENSISSCDVDRHFIEGDGAGPSSYELKAEAVDLGELKMEKDKDSSRSSKEEDGASRQKYSARKKIEFINGEIRKSVTHKIYRCKHCKYFTISSSHLTRHMRTHGEKFGKRFFCIKCEKEFSSKQSLDYHIMTSHSNDGEMLKSVTHKIHHCKHCKYTTASASNLTKHAKRKHGKETLKSTFDGIKCQKEIAEKQRLVGYIVERHSNRGEMVKSVTHKIHRCKHCEYFTVRKIHLIQHMRTHGEKFGVIFDCTKCDKEFLSKQSLDNHIVTLHGDDSEMLKGVTCKILRCKNCRYVTIKKSDLTKHMSKHEEKLKTKIHCIGCEKKFANKQRLDNHIVVCHRNDSDMMNSVTHKIHFCKHCNYITPKKSYLSKHMKTHGENYGKVFDCITCEKEFANKYSLDSHIVAYHGNNSEMMKSVTHKIHRCKNCKYFTMRKAHLTQHMRTHGEKSLDCIKCEKEFSSKQSLDNHIVKLHSDDGEMMKSITYKILRCKKCRYITVTSSRLTKHMKTHGGKLETTVACMEREKKFVDKKRLDDHIVVYHRNDPDTRKISPV